MMCSLSIARIGLDPVLDSGNPHENISSGPSLMQKFGTLELPLYVRSSCPTGQATIIVLPARLFRSAIRKLIIAASSHK